MSYSVDVLWEKKPGEAFTDNHYSRSHRWVFDAGIEVTASASPHVVPLPYSNPNAVDPEEAFVAAISSCHMLWFLSIAAEKNLCVESYADHASGVLGKDKNGLLAMTKVTLNPKVEFSTVPPPTRQEMDGIHHLAHEKCFIANSVKTEITIIPG